MRAIFIALFISCLSLSAAMGQSAGNGTIKGFLRSKPDNQPLPFSAVMLQNPKDSSVAYSAVSNDKGFFQITGIADGEYRFVATYLGYTPLERNINISRGARTMDFGVLDMEEAEITLNQVTVKEDRIPVTVKQDTLEFDASAYKLRDNAVVEDILKRLPGVEVGTDGTIKAMGENVTEITVDGQPFFGSDPKLATRNLPADIVSKIQVHDKKSDQAQFTGIDDGNTKKAINITLKKDKNEGVFGRITAGGGQTAANDLSTRFSLNGNVNRFRGKERISLLGSGNNVNDLGFSFSDLMTSFGGGGQPGEGGGGLSDLLGGGGGNAMRMVQGGRGGLSGALTGAGSAGITTAYAGGLNYRNEWGGGKLKFNSSYFGSQSNTVNDEERLRQTILEDGSFSKLDEGHSENERANHRLNMNLEYQIDSSRSLIFRPTLTYSKQNALSDNVYESVNFENVLLNDGNTLTRSDNTRPALSGNLLYRQRLRKAGRTISINLTGSYNDQDTEQLNQSDNRFYMPGGALLNDSSFNQLSFQQSINERLGARVAYTEPLGKNKFLELNYDFNNNIQNSDRVTYDFNELTGGYDIVNDVFSNNFENTFTTHQGGFNYRYQKLKYDYTLGMSVQESKISSESPEQQSAFSRSFLNFFPVAQFNYNFSQSKRLRINYRGNARNPSVSQLQPVPDVSNPQSIRLGNPELSPEISHNVNLNFNNFNMSTMQSMFLSLRSTLTNNRIVNSTSITGRGQQTIIPVNTDGAWNASAFAAVGMPVIKKIKLNVNFNANFNYDHYANIFNGSENITNSLTTGGGFRFSLTPNEKFDASLGANMSFNKAEQSIQAQLNSEFINYTASADFNWTLPLNFVIGSDARLTANRGGSSTYNQEAILWGAYVEKRFLKNNSGALRLQAYDLLNQNINVSRTVGDGYIEDVSTSILQQYFLLSFTYKFGKFAGQNMQMPPGMRMMRF